MRVPFSVLALALLSGPTLLAQASPMQPIVPCPSCGGLQDASQEAFLLRARSLLGTAPALEATPAIAETPLQRQIRAIAAEARGRVSVACSLPASNLDCGLDPLAHPPMQSVFKAPLAIAALHLIEKGALRLEEPVRFLAKDRILPKTHSPLQDQFPDAEVDVPLHDLLRLAVSESDNVAADIVLRIIGGPEVVDAYVRSLGIDGFHLEDGEHGLSRDARAQYRNWCSPAAAVELLRRLGDGSLLDPAHTRLLLDFMRESPTGPHRIKGELPPGTIVMHKTGSSGTDKGLTSATNDIGLIVLPDGRRLAIAVFVTDSTADEATRDAVIARIARAAYLEGTRQKDSK
jgi:beta-lactamase class A